MTADSSVAKKAAFGRRQPVRGALRTWFGWKFDGLQRRRRPSFAPPALVFVPPPRDAREMADLTARANWYLGHRGVPLYVAGGPTGVKAADAPYMDPVLVEAATWASGDPPPDAWPVVHRVTARTFWQLVTKNASSFASASASIASEDAYFHLGAALGSVATVANGPLESLVGANRKARTAYVLATGPTARLVDLENVHADVRITCNSAVRDRELIERFDPNVITFNDRVFHFGPNKYAAAFRRDLLWVLQNSSATFVTSDQWYRPLVTHVPEIASRLVVLEQTAKAWSVPTVASPRVRSTGNVLTNLMLPIAYTLADAVSIAGCDGRQMSERYFWKHNPASQYSDDLMLSAFTAHPAFFRDRSYTDYYSGHVQELEELLAFGEAHGIAITADTPSHMQPLISRGAPDLAESA